MLISAQDTFSWEQAVTVDAISANVLDLLTSGGALNAGATGGPSANTVRDIGAGKQLYLHALVTTAFTTGDAATLTVTLESDSTANLATSATVHDTYITTVAAATLVAGYWIAKGVPIPAGDYERYLGLRYTTTTGDMTAGKISAWISADRHDTRTYESGQTTGIN
jgi:hypothetical protein